MRELLDALLRRLGLGDPPPSPEEPDPGERACLLPPLPGVAHPLRLWLP